VRLRATRAVIATLVVLLLVGGAIEWWLLSRPQSKEDVSPVLSGGELMRYVTYKRLCTTSRDCEWPLVCTKDERVQNRRCLTSECETDLQCEPGFACMAVRSAPVVRICKGVGVREEGERCSSDSPLKDESCRTGLLCVRGHCGRPCSAEDPAGCPPAHACVGSRNGAACVPRCTPESCPPGKQCIRFDDELAVCGTLVTTNCDQSPCPEDQVCDRATVGRKDQIAMRCLPPCGPKKACPTGSYCFGNVCQRLCSQSKECGPLEECVRFPALHLSICEFKRG
jgi:hypothetical protein